MIWRCSSLAGLAALAGGAALLLAAGCDPCFGVGQCIGVPGLEIEGELLVHGVDTQPLGAQGVAVEFRRTGGVALEAEVSETGERRVDTDSEMRLSSTQLAYDPWRITRRGVGPSPQYQGELFHRESGERAAGVHIEFRRSEGARTKPEAYATITDAAGRFPLVLQASEAGTVLAELVVHLPMGGEPERIPIEMPTFEGDEVRLLGVWGIGSALGEGEEADG